MSACSLFFPPPQLVFPLVLLLRGEPWQPCQLDKYLATFKWVRHQSCHFPATFALTFICYTSSWSSSTRNVDFHPAISARQHSASFFGPLNKANPLLQKTELFELRPSFFSVALTARVPFWPSTLLMCVLTALAIFSASPPSLVSFCLLSTALQKERRSVVRVLLSVEGLCRSETSHRRLARLMRGEVILA